MNVGRLHCAWSDPIRGIPRASAGIYVVFKIPGAIVPGTASSCNAMEYTGAMIRVNRRASRWAGERLSRVSGRGAGWLNPDVLLLFAVHIPVWVSG